MVTILGAGGAIGDELVKRLAARHQPIRLVSRNPKLVPGATEAVAADLSRLDDAVRAVAGATIAFLVGRFKIRSQSLAGAVASDHAQHDRSREARPSPIDLLRQSGSGALRGF